MFIDMEKFNDILIYKLQNKRQFGKNIDLRHGIMNFRISAFFLLNMFDSFYKNNIVLETICARHSDCHRCDNISKIDIPEFRVQ